LDWLPAKLYNGICLKRDTYKKEFIFLMIVKN
jgi:hypothetical protein